MDRITKDDFGGRASETRHVGGVAYSLGNRQDFVPVSLNIHGGVKHGTEVTQHVTILSFYYAIRTWAIQNSEVGRYVHESTKSGHDITGEVGGVVASEIEGGSIAAKDGKESISCSDSGVVEGRNEFNE